MTRTLFGDGGGKGGGGRAEWGHLRGAGGGTGGQEDAWRGTMQAEEEEGAGAGPIRVALRSSESSSSIRVGPRLTVLAASYPSRPSLLSESALPPIRVGPPSNPSRPSLQSESAHRIGRRHVAAHVGAHDAVAQLRRRARAL